MEKITILGAGNGACATAADLTLRGFPVTLCSRPGSKTLTEIRERGGLEYTGVLGEGVVPLYRITTDLQEAVEGASLIIIVVPGKGQEDYARALAPVLKEGQMVLLSPGRMGGSLYFQRILKERAPGLEIKVGEGNILPYGCRLAGPARVWVYVVNKAVRFGAFPGKHILEMEERVKPLYPSFIPAKNVLECGMNYLNAWMHVAGMIMNAGRIEFTKGDFYFYYQGITPAVGRVLEALDRERVQGLLKLDLPPVPFLDLFFRSGYTTPEAHASGSAYRAFQESEPNKSRKSPPDFTHRYMAEDCPYGLLPISEVCHWAGVATPVMDALIHLSSVATGIDFRKEGITLVKMGLEGLDLKEKDRFLWEGQ